MGAILDNPAYIGITESLKTTRLTFKSKKRVPSPKERRAVIEDSHEPIIDSLVWEKVKTLRQNKRRPTKTGATSIFSGLLLLSRLRRKAEPECIKRLPVFPL